MAHDLAPLLYSVGLHVFMFVFVCMLIFACVCVVCGGEIAQEVRAVVWQSEGCRFDPSMGVSKCL